MADERRLDFDAIDDNGVVNKDLLKDVIAATEQAKKRKADDKARDVALQTKTKDKTMMTAIIAVAAVIMLVFAYWMVFLRAEPEQANQAAPPPRVQTAPVQVPVQQQPQGRQNNGYGRPAPPRVMSDPVRTNQTDTYAEPQDPGGM